MQANKINRQQQSFSSLLNEHWKRKQRLKQQLSIPSASVTFRDSTTTTAATSQPELDLKMEDTWAKSDDISRLTFYTTTDQNSVLRTQNINQHDGKATISRISNRINNFTSQSKESQILDRSSVDSLYKLQQHSNPIVDLETSTIKWPIISDNRLATHCGCSCGGIIKMKRQIPTAKVATIAASNMVNVARVMLTAKLNLIARRSRQSSRSVFPFTMSFLPLLLLLIMGGQPEYSNGNDNGRKFILVSAVATNSDPRPTIYSGQVSFGLLLSAHSSMGSEMSTSASHQVNSLFSASMLDELPPTTIMVSATTTTPAATTITTQKSTTSQPTNMTTEIYASDSSPIASFVDLKLNIDQDPSDESRMSTMILTAHNRRRARQIFERPTGKQQSTQVQQKLNAKSLTNGDLQTGSSCGQVNSNALYAGMSAIWASHQANLVGDSQLNIGTYVYDSCNDLDVGQRQAVRIVSNLNAFQQTTCESPRGSPISLTIAHGDNQLRAIQLLTSFRVPVITTKEHFALEDYNQLSRDQRRFLFSTAPSSRHLAVGALKFSKRIVSRSTSSPKLLNQFYKMSSRNGLIVISRNLPARFISYLTEIIPNHVNYEMLQTSQPIDQIRSVEVLESILISKTSTSNSASNSLRDSISGGESRTSSEMRNADGKILRRQERSGDETSTDGSGTTSGNGPNDFDIPGEGENPKMLSPTILMFITPSEAIDLITRLRNDLAEVSKYYSLIVSTREDISPALRTIFHRGGSRLCSGKAFYTISPQPDDISEFSRYFRDTVQMEGETSDHPLICEFAKYQSTSKLSADLDDISTEPIIKAVWAAAAAFKSVHKRECASATASGQSNGYRSALSNEEKSPNSGRQVKSSSSSSSSATQTGAECMGKMNKVMSSLVQRALRRMDVPINSTGLQALDGFRIKFDDMNELLTNKFSIRHVNKECEITEIGQFTGFKDSSLRLDEDLLVKSLETTLPDPWPVSSQPQTTSATSSSSSSANTGSSTGNHLPVDEASNSGNDNNKLDSSSTSVDDSGVDGKVSDNNDDPTATSRRRQKSGIETQSDESTRPEDDDSTSGDSNGDFKIGESDNPPGKRITSKRSRQNVQNTGSSRLNRRNKPETKSKSTIAAKQAAPVTAMGGRGMVPGLTDTEDATNSPVTGDLKNLLTTTSDTTATSEPAKSTLSMMRKLKPYPTTVSGSALKDWLPVTSAGRVQESTKSPSFGQIVSTTLKQLFDNEQVDPDALIGGHTLDLKARSTTQAPIFTTLPESGGNADLELPSRSTPEFHTSRGTTGLPASMKNRPLLDIAATTESSDYVTATSISQNLFSNQPTPIPTKVVNRNGFTLDGQSISIESDHNEAGRKLNYLRDINSSPVPLDPTLTRSSSESMSSSSPLYSKQQQQSDHLKNFRFKLRSQLRYIHSSWLALSVLATNICGALFTLYVLVFLLLKNCDGSLDRENQGIRSMHLLAIIVVFFGSTLFIVYPTPGLCLLRNSWHNFSLVLLFGSLLLQTMQTRSLSSLGLGGRPNRLNQFLTLLFMVGVQVSFELQKWKYESSSYINFVHQYFGSSEVGEKKLIVLSSSIANQFNPLNSFNDQVTPVSIQVSEKYQSLLQEYCAQHTDDFIQSQIYLMIIVGLLIIFSISTRKSRRLSAGGSGSSSSGHRLVTSGKLVASQHEANLSSPSSHQYPFSSNVVNANNNARNLFIVTIITAPIYVGSILMQIYGQIYMSHDLVSSFGMVAIAFTTLIGIFLPVLRQVHRYEELMSERISGTITRQIAINNNQQQHLQQQQHFANSSPNSTSAFAMFPEFAQTGLRRPSSVSGDSSSGAGGSRRPFAETKESRRNMGVALASLGPSADSLRNMGFYDDRLTPSMADNRSSHNNIDPALLNLKLNLSNNHELAPIADDLFKASQQIEQQTAKRNSKGEKRLIMLDVDPCCPRHGIATSTRPIKNMGDTTKCNTNQGHSGGHHDTISPISRPSRGANHSQHQHQHHNSNKK